MSEAYQVVCSKCETANRIPRNKSAQLARCGQCQQALLSGQTLILGDANFDTFITKSDLPIVVDFWAEWCAPCRTMAPILAQVAQDLSDSVLFAKVDTDEHQRLAARFAIRGIPTLIIFREGAELVRQAGVQDASSLKRWISHTLK